MRKFLVLLSMVTCLLGMTACGSEPEYTAQEQSKISAAENYAKNYVIQYFIDEEADYDAESYESAYTSEEIAEQYSVYAQSRNDATFDGISMEEVEMYANMTGMSTEDYIDSAAADVAESYGIDKEEALKFIRESIVTYSSTESSFETSGSVIKSGFTSVKAGLEITGKLSYKNLGEPTARIDHETIIVTVPVVDAEKEASFEVIVSNDKYLRLESVALNVKYSFGETMAKAGQNTLVGIGTVFVMLILISFIISLFAYIPKIQNGMGKKKESPKAEAIEKAVAQIVELEEAQSEDLTDDLELVAVIAAAIAAYEGQTSTDGFVVRSIRKVNRR